MAELYQYLHYPLSDWDILILGMGWHRFFITHSLIIPIVLMLFFLQNRKLYLWILGLCVGLSSHLVWDAITCSMRTPVVFIANILEIRGYLAKGWLIINCLLLFSFAFYIAKDKIEL